MNDITPIALLIKNYISKKGFVTIDQFMHQSLSLYSNSYYSSCENILGSEGDFTTSPEISQLFGEIIGLWIIEQYHKLNFPPRINIVELGPGRGLLMQDLLRICKLDKALYNAIEINLVEVNPTLISNQKDILTTYEKNITWLKDITKLPKLPTIFIANEFFDAMPIRQFIKLNNIWYERVVRNTNNKLAFGYHPIDHNTNLSFLKKYPLAQHGGIIEDSPSSLEILQLITQHINNFSGAGIIIDYGYYIDPSNRGNNQYNSTLQAVKNHAYHPVLSSPGTADLTAHVDFYQMKKNILKAGINSYPISSQHDFLVKYGILIRQNLLNKTLSTTDKDLLNRQIERLIAPTYMGELFKVLEFSSF